MILPRRVNFKKTHGKVWSFKWRIPQSQNLVARNYLFFIPRGPNGAPMFLDDEEPIKWKVNHPKRRSIGLTGYSYLYIQLYRYIYIYTPRKSQSTKLCPLVGSGILYMDHPKNQPLCLVDWTSKVHIYIYMDIYIYISFPSHPMCSSFRGKLKSSPCTPWGKSPPGPQFR